MVDPEVKRQQWMKIAKYGFMVVASALTAPLAFLALEGALAWAAAAAVVAIVVNFSPVVGTYIANKRVQALVAVIEANPIETMQNLLVEKTQEYQKQESAVTEFDTQFRNVSDMVEGLKKTDPDEAVQYVQMRDQMKVGLDELRGEQRAAQGELKNAQDALAKMRRLWAVACAMNKALAANATAQSRVFQKMKEDVAVDTVRTNLNRAFANLNTAVERRRNASLFTVTAEAPKALPDRTDAAGNIIDIKTSAPVRR